MQGMRKTHAFKNDPYPLPEYLFISISCFKCSITYYKALTETVENSSLGRGKLLFDLSACLWFGHGWLTPLHVYVPLGEDYGFPNHPSLYYPRLGFNSA